MDLNIIAQRNAKSVDVARTLRSALEWGYTTVALNTIIETECFGKEGVNIPEVSLKIETEDIDSSCQVLSRLTVKVKDEKQCHQLTQSPHVKKYDILALEPMNEKVLASMCANIEFDIMCLDLCNISYPLKREQLKLAKEKGVHFEIRYTQLFDERKRTWAIANGRNLVSAVCKKNIIVCSGATNYLQIRKPESVINICNLFGLSKEEGKYAVLRNGQVVLKQAKMRTRTGKTVVSIQDANKLNSKEMWLVKTCKLKAENISILPVDSMEEEKSIEENCEISPKRQKIDKVSDNMQ